jgi:hypothetical protein
MPVRYKHTLIFSGRNKGWSESYYTEPTSVNLQSQLTLCQIAATARAQMLGAEYSIQALRVQQTEDAGGAPVKRVGDLNQAVNLPGPAAWEGAQSDLSVLFDWATVNRDAHKFVFCGGIWDACSVLGGVYSPPPEFNTAWQTWGVKCVEAGYGWLSRVPAAPVAVSNYVQDENSGTVTLTFGASLFEGASNTPVLIRVSGLPSIGGMSTLNGDLLVYPLSATTARTKDRIAVFPFIGPGRANRFTNVFKRMSFITPEKIVSRERGAPLLQSPGRRSARARG